MWHERANVAAIVALCHSPLVEVVPGATDRRSAARGHSRPGSGVLEYADHLLCYSAVPAWARSMPGRASIDRATLADCVGHAAFHLRPLHERLFAKLKIPAVKDDDTSA